MRIIIETRLLRCVYEGLLLTHKHIRKCIKNERNVRYRIRVILIDRVGTDNPAFFY